MQSFKSFINEDIFIGHKLKLEELRKYVYNWSDRIKQTTEYLKKNSNVGEYGYFCKDYPEYVSLYWNSGGKKLQPSKKECEDRIKKEWDIKDINKLNDDQKWDLFNKGLRPE